MNGVHDMGGQHSFGPVVPEADQAAFHADWEKRALAITLAMGGLGLWNIDQMRHEREKLPPSIYLSSSYYRIWTLALENVIEALGILQRTDLTARTGDELIGAFSRQGSYERPIGTEPAYAVGQSVRTKQLNPAGHTRLPRYARGKTGVVIAVRGAHVFPDRNAVPLGQQAEGRPEWLYTVDFHAVELWGEDADPALVVSIDAWEPYLERLS